MKKSVKLEENSPALIAGAAAFFILLTIIAWQDEQAFLEAGSMVQRLIILMKGAGAAISGFGTTLFVHSFTGGTHEDKMTGIIFFLAGNLMIFFEYIIKAGGTPIL